MLTHQTLVNAPITYNNQCYNTKFVIQKTFLTQFSFLDRWLDNRRFTTKTLSTYYRKIQNMIMNSPVVIVVWFFFVLITDLPAGALEIKLIIATTFCYVNIKITTFLEKRCQKTDL